MNFKELEESWLPTYKKRVKFKTYKDVVSCLDRYVISKIGDKDIDSVTNDDVFQLISEIAKQSINLSLRNFGLIRQIYAFGYVKGYTKNDPTYRVDELIEKKWVREKKEFLSIYQLQSYFDVTFRGYEINGKHTCRLEIMIPIFVQSLMVVRISELVQIKRTDIDLNNGHVYISAEKTKMGREHIACIPLQLKKIIALYLDWHDSEWAFPCFKNHLVHIKPHSLQDRNNKGGAGKSMIGRHTLHGFRHTFSTHANESGLWNKDAIEMCLAHKSFNVRSIYNKALYLNEREKIMQWYADQMYKYVDFDKYRMEERLCT